ncbi:MAG: hypothetical protein CMM87_07090 [Rickettsiales bacterium]|nr:hypothetical protein [Rickettsiales bacterium]|tara:strand:+ start:7163 stop:9154 length:1992 start_codon:yes stop_codon:yes gene_type:complete
MSFMRVLSLIVPLRRETPPSAIAVLRDNGQTENGVLTRLACVVNNSLQFVHAVSVYQLRTLMLLTNEFEQSETQAQAPLFHVSVVVIPSPRYDGAPSVSVVAELSIEVAMIAQRHHTYWCWQLTSLLELSWGAPTNPALHSVHHNNARDLMHTLQLRYCTPHSASLPWYCRQDKGCWIQGGEILLRPPCDARGVVVRGGDRSLVLHYARQLPVNGRILIVAPSPVLRYWWKCAVACDDNVECRVAHEMLNVSVLHENFGLIVWDAVQPFPMHCTINRPRVKFNLVLAPTENGVANTRNEHALCRLLGMSQMQIQSMLLPPASMVVHSPDSFAGVTELHFCHVRVPEDMRDMMDNLNNVDAHANALLDDLPTLVRCKDRQATMFGTPLSTNNAKGAVEKLNCPMCEIESRCDDYPLLMLPACGHAVCVHHFPQWSHQCAICRCPNSLQMHDLPVIRRTGKLMQTCGASDLMVVPIAFGHALEQSLQRHWQDGALPPKLELCVNLVCRKLTQGARVVLVIAEHDSAVVAVSATLQARGVNVQTKLNLHDEARDQLMHANCAQTVICIAQRMVSSAARLAWMTPPDLGRGAVHAVCATSTLAIMSVIKMLQGCGTGCSVTYTAYKDTPEERCLRSRLNDFQQASPVAVEVVMHDDDEFEETAANVV